MAFRKKHVFCLVIDHLKNTHPCKQFDPGFVFFYKSSIATSQPVNIFIFHNYFCREYGFLLRRTTHFETVTPTENAFFNLFSARKCPKLGKKWFLHIFSNIGHLVLETQGVLPSGSVRFWVWAIWKLLVQKLLNFIIWSQPPTVPQIWDFFSFSYSCL